MEYLNSYKWNSIKLKDLIVLSIFYDLYIDGDSKSVVLLKGDYKWNEF